MGSVFPASRCGSVRGSVDLSACPVIVLFSRKSAANGTIYSSSNDQNVPIPDAVSSTAELDMGRIHPWVGLGHKIIRLGRVGSSVKNI